MTKQQNDKDLKVKESFLIKINSRNENQKITFTRWINAQNKPQDSLLAIINHMVDRFGYVDVMDHEISKKLYTEMLHFDNSSEVITTTDNSFDKMESVSLEESHDVETAPVKDLSNSKINKDAF